MINNNYAITSLNRLTIDSLDELAKNEKIGCGAWGEQTKEFFLSSLDIAGQTIGYKLEYVDDTFLAVSLFAYQI